MSMEICERMARRITARSNMVKKCVVGNGVCSLHIEESVFIQNNAYRCRDLESDIDGFVYDVDRELNAIDPSLQCDRGSVNVNVDRDSHLFTLSYDCAVDVDAEKVRTNEWQIERI